MRLFAVFFVVASLSAQDSKSLDVYTYDANGRRIPVNGFGSSSGAAGSSKVETTSSVNGGRVPLQDTEEKVLSETPSSRKVERLIKYNDANGRYVRTERVLVDEEKKPDGGVTVTTTTYRSNINGSMDLSERSTLTSSKSGNTTKSETTTERRGIDGGFGVVERRETVVNQASGNSEADSTLYRRDLNGSFRPEEREIVKTIDTPSGSRVESTTYNTGAGQDVNAKLKFSVQRVTETVKGPDGSESIVTDVYAASAPGRAAEGTKPQLKERLVTERRAKDGGYVESLSVQRPGLADGRLGNPQPVSQTVCTGSCIEKQKTAEAKK